jgi:hypothetical protein
MSPTKSSGKTLRLEFLASLCEILVTDIGAGTLELKRDTRYMGLTVLIVTYPFTVE